MPKAAEDEAPTKPVHYLKAAKWGFEQMVERSRHLNSAFVFHIVGVLTMASRRPICALWQGPEDFRRA